MTECPQIGEIYYGKGLYATLHGPYLLVIDVTKRKYPEKHIIKARRIASLYKSFENNHVYIYINELDPIEDEELKTLLKLSILYE